ncbi:sodium- and chloride-dependent GABA transporter ine [Lingula anatina]|uniref:Sodium- and chloride-dependent GABA transporter ine n=1 Tax=Lingula anatina TaxID=7574 RepID=A0A1S3H0I8_LINAN|nr:sodium- and chloride-dependent GABA transporter ine [Lingula anatina]XP_013378685.1 sodium- and chloride-dependent GABA transporter ine [Lingula anatina]XP_013378686.1 sodium- and chloride-dependent GABA transporter ine [Lingula anatina]|eukprot:XP_013378684.1 sodium- and chloride-dependent GABA transporter ine [Lingula anatina]
MEMAEPKASWNLVQMGLASLSVVGLRSFYGVPNSILLFGASVTYWVSSVLCLLVVMVPILLVQLQLGAKTGKGVVGSIGQYFPLFKGFGISFLIWQYLVLLFDSSTMGASLYYTFASLVSPYPWEKCSNIWNTPNCKELVAVKEKVTTTTIPSLLELNLTVLDNFGSLEEVYPYSYYNVTFEFTDFPRVDHSPASEYFSNFVLEQGPVGSLNEVGLGGVSWPVAVSLIAVWFLVFLGSCFGVSAFGKIMYVIGPVVVIMFFVVLSYGHLTFDAGETWRFVNQSYRQPSSVIDAERNSGLFFKMVTTAVWNTFSLLYFTCGTISTLGKYVGFGTKSECPLYFLWVVFIGIMLVLPHNIYAFYAPYLAAYVSQFGVPVRDIHIGDVSGDALLFILLPEIFTGLRVPNVIAVLTYATITLFGLIGFVLVVVVILDHVMEALGTWLRPHPMLWRILITGIFCTVTACLSLVFSTRAGSYLYFELMPFLYSTAPLLTYFIFLNIGIAVAYVQLDLPVWSRTVIGSWFIMAFIALATANYMATMEGSGFFEHPCELLGLREMPDWICGVGTAISWIPLIGVPVGLFHSLITAPGTCCQCQLKLGALIVPDTHQRAEEQEDEMYPVGSYTPLSQQPRPPPVIEIEDKVTVF